MKRLLIDFTYNVLSSKNAKYHGGGGFSRFILHEIERYNQDYLNNIILIWPKNQQTLTDEERKIKSKFNIIEVTDVMNIKYEADDLLFFPLIDSFNLNIVGKLKRKFPCLRIYCVLHGLRLIDVERVDLYDKYYYSGIKSNLLYLQIRRTVASIIAKMRIKKNLTIIDRCYTVSNCSMQKINSFADVRYIRYFYQGINMNNYNEDKDKKYYDDRFVLFVSANRYEKNFIRSLVAFCNYKLKSRSNLKLYAVGTNKVFNNKLCKIKGIDGEILNNDVKLLGYVSQNEMHQLYSNCEFLLYPSKSEGYGLPPLEAMKHGRPTVAASTTSVPEVLGMAAYYVNPYKVDQIADGIAFMDQKNNQKLYIDRMKLIENVIDRRAQIDVGFFVKEISEHMMS